MKTSILICATCLIVATGCSAQLRFPSLSSALSSLTGFGSSSSAAASGSGSSAGSSASQPSSPYSGLVRDYGRNLMMAMSNIYPTLFKPPQAQQSAQAPMAQPQGGQSPFDQAFGASQFGSSLYSGQAPSFSFGGSTFSISPSLPFGSLGQTSGAQGGSGGGPSASASHSSPFATSFGSSINSPSSFGPLSSSPFLQQQMPSFAPATSYSAAFEAANGGPAGQFGAMSSGPLVSGPSQQLGQSSQQLMSQSSGSAPMGSASAYVPSLSAFQHDMPLQQQQQPPSGPHGLQQQQQAGQHQASQQQVAQFGPQNPGQQHQAAPQVGQYQAAGQQYQRPDVMSLAASAPVPSSSSYSNYASIPSGPSSQQAPASPSSYQQPSYR